jgi:membrane protein DedA with SNARE-associated domain
VPAGLASALWYALLILAGTTISREWTHVRDFVAEGSGALGLVGLVLTAVAGFWLWRQNRRRND